uniref:hypothetical protein n=1 Tax=uncultured Parabacteroides sp. TaxID=512312 RepID=UPI0026603366
DYSLYYVVHKIVLLKNEFGAVALIGYNHKILHYNPIFVYSLDYGKVVNLHTINLIPDSCDE